MVQTTLFNEKLLNLFKLHIINEADTDKYTEKYIIKWMIFMMKNCYNIEQNKWSTIDTIYMNKTLNDNAMVFM